MSWWIGVPLAALAASLLGCMGEPLPALDAARIPLPPMIGLPDLAANKHGDLVRQGYAIFTDTPRYARRFSGNALSCANCHLDAGRRANAAPMWGSWGMYPAYLAKTDRVTTLQDRVQQCFRFSLNGLPPPLDSQEMQALMSYMQWLSTGHPIGLEQEGRGFPTVKRTGQDPDAFRGKALYAAKYSACHGRQGEGARATDGRWAYPPLWGHASFNKGAGMNRLDLMAGFLKANMPYDKPDLTDQQALDIAAWVILQERWPDPRKGLLTGLLER